MATAQDTEMDVLDQDRSMDNDLQMVSEYHEISTRDNRVDDGDHDDEYRKLKGEECKKRKPEEKACDKIGKCPKLNSKKRWIEERQCLKWDEVGHLGANCPRIRGKRVEDKGKVNHNKQQRPEERKKQKSEEGELTKATKSRDKIRLRASDMKSEEKEEPKEREDRNGAGDGGNKTSETHDVAETDRMPPIPDRQHQPQPIEVNLIVHNSACVSHVRIPVERVFGDLPRRAKDTMTKYYFIGALDDGEMRTKVATLSQKVQDLRMEVEKMKLQQSSEVLRTSRKCFKCGEIGHLRYNCPNKTVDVHGNKL